MNKMVCGDGYLPESLGCTTCAPGYFQSLQLCEPCPANKSDAIVRGVSIALFVVGVFVIALIMIGVAVCRTGGQYGTGMLLLVSI